MDHLQAGVEWSFAVFPEFSTFFQPCEGSFDHPSLGHDGEGMQFAPFGDLHRCAELVLDGFGKRLAGVAAIDQHAADLLEVVGAAVERGQSTLAVGHVGCRYGYRMRQSLRIHRDVALDAGDLLARVIALLPSRIGVLNALRVHDQEAGRGAASLSGAVLANRFFLRPVPGRLRHPDRAPTTSGSTNGPCATWDTRPAACATGNRS